MPDTITPTHRERGERTRQVLEPGDQLTIQHFGTIRTLTFVRASKSRSLFRWTAASSGKTRDLWLSDVQLGWRIEETGELFKIVCGDGTVSSTT